MQLNESAIPGCYEVVPSVHTDARGTFVKTFHAPTFHALGLATDFAEEFYSESNKNVIRGMHFQLPPEDHIKLVYCTSGVVMDVVVDLRQGSPAYGRHAVFELSPASANMVYIPKGMAHGFCALSDRATMMYKTSTAHAPDLDHGIRWDSAGIRWPVMAPILSARDAGLPSLDQFASPFRYREHDA